MIYKYLEFHFLRSAWVLKECSSEIASILAYIYSESLAQGNVPDDLRQANVAPIFEKR